ncbi:response regulator [Nocardioides sp. SYSU DS0651]|uniref:response regulator n=1 Tax=Nocardioides sp. SYSU DS0651 TaxID=3415955 RepID=UPI003F4C5E35
MKILLVEDEERSVRDAMESIEREVPDAEVTVAGSRDDALAALDRGDFDLILCDIRLPPHGDSADIQEVHGLSVQAAIRRSCPGTPVIFLTGFATSRDTRSQLSLGGVDRVFGVERYPLVDLVDKDDPVALESKLAELAAGLKRVLSVGISGGEAAPAAFRRAVGLYALSTGHDSAEVTLLAGASGAAVGRVRLAGVRQTPAAIFLKTTDHRKAEDEYTRYRQHVSNRLAPGFFAPTHEPVSGSLGRFSAIVSTLADGDKSLFDLVAAVPETGPDLVHRLQAGIRPWTSPSRGRMTTTLGDLRRRGLTDERLRHSRAAVDLASKVERIEVEVGEVICHGDLHGENVLVDLDGRPVLIDFADTGPGPAPLDPITLELSLLFHPHGPARQSERPLNWADWPDVDAFAAGSAFEPFIRATRAWAYELGTEAEVMACAYAHALRQVKYDDVDSGMAVAIASAAARRLEN